MILNQGRQDEVDFFGGLPRVLSLPIYVRSYVVAELLLFLHRKTVVDPNTSLRTDGANLVTLSDFLCKLRLSGPIRAENDNRGFTVTFSETGDVDFNLRHARLPKDSRLTT